MTKSTHWAWTCTLIGMLAYGMWVGYQVGVDATLNVTVPDIIECQETLKMCIEAYQTCNADNKIITYISNPF